MRTLCLLAALAACTPELDDERMGLGDAGTSDGLSPRGFAVVSSDYEVSSVSLLSLGGEVLQREFIHSGATATGLVTALSGDVILPTHGGEPGVLVLLDRFRTDVITRVDLGSGEVLGQLKTHDESAETDQEYSSNPRDYVHLDAHNAWVSRYEPALSPGSSEPTLGVDLLRLDPKRLERTGDRIMFSRWDMLAERENPDTTERQLVTVYARPSSLVKLGDFLAVGIDTLSAAFDANGEGMVALVHVSSRKVNMLRLPKLQGCGELSPVPGDETRVAVACSGSYRSKQRDAAGLAMLVVQDGELAIEHVWRAQDAPSAAVTIHGVQALDDDEVLATAAGDEAAGTFDTLYRVRLDTGTQRRVFEAAGQYVLGQSAYDATTGTLMLPDASADRVGRPTAGVQHLQRKENGDFELQTTIVLDDILPPRQVRLFY